MTTSILVINWLCGLVVLAEALNKMERTDLFNGHTGLHKFACLRWLLVPWKWEREHLVNVLKLTGWVLLAIAGAGAMVTPLLHWERPHFQGIAGTAGFAFLILRTRLKEAKP